MSERAGTAAVLLEQWEADPPTDEKPYELEVSYRGGDWERLVNVCTDLSDEAKPVFVDTEKGRLALKGGDEVRVRDVLIGRAVR